MHATRTPSHGAPHTALPRTHATAGQSSTAARQSAAEALLRRWLVEYNPLYLASATCVLAGIWILAREAAQKPTVFGALSVWMLAELYAVALIGGAAFLMRIRQGRAATMLALIAAVFQVDPTMHLETSAYLGAVGVVTSIGWAALCGAKLYALCWGLQVRPSRSASAVLLLGGLGLAVIPHMLRVVGPASRSVLICGWLFLVFGAALATRREVYGRAEWDARARRAVHATWALWGALLLAHAGYWAVDLRVNMLPLFPAAAALTLPVWRREQHVWAAGAFAVGLGYVFVPALFGFDLALVATGVLAAAARGLVAGRQPAAPRGFEHPYRGDSRPRRDVAPLVANDAARARLVLGALLFAYAALCAPDLTVTREHAQPLALLLPFTTLLCAASARQRGRWFALPVAPLVLQAVWERGWVPRPETALAWGVLSTTMGFVLLALGLCASWWVAAHMGTGTPDGALDGDSTAPCTANGTGAAPS